MRVLVIGSAGHLGEALVRTLRERQHEVTGLDLLDSPFTTHVGSITDSHFVRGCVRGVDFVIHTATLHKPHVATHSRRAFVRTNVCGTLNILEAALASGVSGVVFTSSTSAFGAALSPAKGQSLPLGSPKACSPFRRTSTGLPRRLRRNFVSCSTGRRVCLPSCSEPRGSSPRRTTTPNFDNGTMP